MLITLHAFTMSSAFPPNAPRTSTRPPHARRYRRSQACHAIRTVVILGGGGIPAANLYTRLRLRGASTKVIKISWSYTGVVDKMVWRKTGVRWRVHVVGHRLSSIPSCSRCATTRWVHTV